MLYAFIPDTVRHIQKKDVFLTVKARVKNLENECDKNRVERRRDDECVAYVIPKRNIETWIKVAEKNAANVNEDDDYGHMRGEEAKRGQAGKIIEELVESGRTKELANFSSLKYLEKEYWRLLNIQNAI